MDNPAEKLASDFLGRMVKIRGGLYPSPNRISSVGATEVLVSGRKWPFGAHRSALTFSSSGEPIVLKRR